MTVSDNLSAIEAALNEAPICEYPDFTAAVREVLALARKAEAMERENAELRKTVADCSDALSAFADSVFNDNGDMTVNLGWATGDDYVRAYFADRRARTLLNGGSDAQG